MLTIRLSRIGKKNKPMYRLIISEKSHDPYGKALEILGSYNPHTKELIAKSERITYWISKGAGTSPTVNNLLIEKKIIKGDKMKTSKISKKRAEKISQKTQKKTESTEKESQNAQNKITESTENKAEEAEKPAEEPAEKIDK